MYTNNFIENEGKWAGLLKETINEYDLSVKTSKDLLVPGFEFAKGKGRNICIKALVLF